MKLLNFYFEGKKHLGALKEGRIIELTVFNKTEDLLVKGEEGLEEAYKALEKEEISFEEKDVELLPPLTEPQKIICIGLNYYSHCEEQKTKVPEHPIIFSKFINTLTASGRPIIKPFITEKLDYEAELAVVIGRKGKRITRRDALSYIAGYMNFNDVSARDIQFGDRQWVRGKTLDTFAPIGPYLVTADEIKDPQKLSIKCWVNDELRQDSTTEEMIFDIPYLIEFVSQAITLKPGDIIATGTPKGVGAFRNPPVFLKAGDTVKIEIENLGVLENTVAEEVF